RPDHGASLDSLAGKVFAEPHSTKQTEDFVAWGSEIDPHTLIDTEVALAACGRESFRQVCGRVRCPVLVIHGDDDALRPLAQGGGLAAVTGGELVIIAGGGHCPMLRDPVVVNRLAEEFIAMTASQPRARTWT